LYGYGRRWGNLEQKLEWDGGNRDDVDSPYCCPFISLFSLRLKNVERALS